MPELTASLASDLPSISFSALDQSIALADPVPETRGASSSDSGGPAAKRQVVPRTPDQGPAPTEGDLFPHLGPAGADRDVAEARSETSPDEVVAAPGRGIAVPSADEHEP